MFLKEKHCGFLVKLQPLQNISRFNYNYFNYYVYIQKRLSN